MVGEFLLKHIDTIIVAVVAVILGWDRLRFGMSGLRKEITQDYKERNVQLEDKIKILSDEIGKTNVTVAELRGQLNEKDKHIESLTLLIQGRNPEILELLKEISISNIKLMEFLKVSDKSSREEMAYQTKMLEASQVK